MPMEPLKFQIPRRNKEKIELFQYVSSESREYEDMLNILSSSYRDAASTGTFIYSRPRLVHNQKLETEYVEKRKELKADSRTDKELEDMYCFLLTGDFEKSKEVCESGLSVGYSWIIALGNPSKGVYLSKYSDLLQINAFIPGTTGEIVICKVMKGKVKSMYDNMSKNLLDPTPKFDCHISKNASKVTSLTSYRAYELSQLYFYEYSFDELITRPRQVCPYAVLAFQFKGKDPLPSKPLATSRMDSQTPACPPKGSNERVQYIVWSGDLVKDERCLYHVSLQSFSPPVLPCKLPEMLEIGCLMSFDHVSKLLPPALFCWKLYAGSHEVVKNDMFCSLLEMTEDERSKSERSKSGNDLSRLLQQLEKHNLVLVETLNDRGLLFLLSSEQMATPTERGDRWKRALQALFIFPESRDVGRSVSPYTSSHDAPETPSVIGRLSTFLPALHHALVKARANPPSDLSGGVVKHATDYLSGLKDGLTRIYPMGEYDAKLDDRGKLFPAPKHHKANMEGYLRNYLYGPTLYLLSVARARNLLVTNLGSDYLEQERKRMIAARLGGRLAQEERAELEQKERERSNGGGAEEERMQDQTTNSQKETIYKKLMDTMMSHQKKKGEGEMGKKRKKEEEVTERTSKYLRGGQERMPAAGLNQANPSPPEEQGEEESEPWSFDRLATRLQLPTNCDLDLRTQEELEEQTRGSVSSLEEGFSPGSHSGSHCGESGLRGRETDEQPEIPWVLIPITGVNAYHRIQSQLPQDPRCHHVAVVSAPTARPTPSPEPSPAASPTPSPPPPNEPASVTPSETRPSNEEPSPANEQRLTSSVSRESAGPDVKDSPYLPAADGRNREIALLVPENNPDPSPLSSLLSVIGSEGLTDIDLRSESPQAAIKLLHLLKEATKESRGEISIPPSAPASIPPSAPPSIHPTPEKRSRTPSPRPTLEQHKVAGGTEEAEEGGVQLEKNEAVEGKESNPEEKKDTEAREAEAEVQMVEEEGRGGGGEVIEVSDEERGGGDVIEVSDTDSPPSSPTPVAPRPRDVDCIIEDLMGNFSSDIQHLLQDESTNYTSMRQFPPLLLHKHTRLAQTHLTIAPFSQYVTFYSSKIPGIPVQPFVSSLRDSMNGVVQDLEPRWPSNQADVGTTNADANDTLASSVSVFVAGIRAATANVSSPEANATNCTGSTAVTVASVGESPSLAKTPHSQQQNNRTELYNGDLSPSLPLSSTSLAILSGPHHRIPTSAHSLPQQHKDIDNSRTFGHEVSLSRLTEESCNAGDVRMSDNDSLHKLPPGGSLQGDVNSGPGSVSLIGLGQGPAPPDIRSLISQLQPEVFSSLEEIIKDVKKNSVQFYIHSTEEYDMHYDHIKDHLLKQGHTEQSPITFMENESTEDRLLIIIQNKDIENHIHKIPGLMRLKQRPSVVFYGVDTVDDLRNNSPNELFVSGGCIVSDEFVLNPDFITHERLAALLMFLEQKSSPECLWRWRVHFKTMKKLKEQARFKREAKSLLEVLTNYQKRLILEILPYHHCDRTSSKSPELECLIELQARYTSHRHVIFLTERRFEMFPNFSSSGIIVANINDITHNFNNVVGYHGSKSQAIPDDLLDLKGVGSSGPSTEDSALGSDLSPPSRDISTSSSSSCTDNHPLPPHPLPPSVSDQPTPRQSAPGSASSHPPSSATLSSSDELIPLLPMDTDFEALRLAISQFREERRVRREEQQETPRVEFGVGPHSSFPLDSNSSSPVGGQLEQIHVARRGSSTQIQGTHSKTTETLDSEQAAQKQKEAVGVQLSQTGAVGKAGTEQVKEKPGKLSDSETMFSDSDMSLCGSQDSSTVQSKNMATQNVDAVATVPNSHSDAAGLATGNRDGGHASSSYTNPAGGDKASDDRPIGGLVAAAPGNTVTGCVTAAMAPGRVNNTGGVPSIATRVPPPGRVNNTAAIPSIATRVPPPGRLNNTAAIPSIATRVPPPGRVNNTAVTRSVTTVMPPGNVDNTAAVPKIVNSVTTAPGNMKNTTVTRSVTNVASAPVNVNNTVTAPVNVNNTVTAPGNGNNTAAVTSGVTTVNTPVTRTATMAATVPRPPLPRLQQLQQQIVHHQNQLQQQSRHLQPGLHPGLLGPGAFHQHNPLLGAGFGGALLGPGPMSFRHPFLWGVQVRGPSNPAIQGNSRFRGWPRGGFNGM